MANGLKYLIALATAFALMLAIRTLVVSIHSINGNGLAPLYADGDQLLINRCSYGLRIGGAGVLPYGRLMRKPVQRGDIVVFTIPTSAPGGSPAAPPASAASTSYGPSSTQSVPGGFPAGLPDGLYIARCAGIPGDTLRTNHGLLCVPGLINCAKDDYYWLEAVNNKNPVDSRHLGFIPECCIIGRVVGVLYNRHNLRLQ